MTKTERLKLDLLSAQAYGVIGRWKKLYDRGCYIAVDYVEAQGKKFQGTKQVPVKRVYRFSIGTIRRIMENKIGLMNANRSE